MRDLDEVRKIVSTSNIDKIIELFNEGYTKEELGFRLISSKPDVILRLEYDKSKVKPVEYLIVSLSEEFLKIFNYSVAVTVSKSGGEIDGLYFSNTSIGEKFKKVGNRYVMKVSTAYLPAIGEKVRVIYELKNGIHRDFNVQVKRPKNKQ